MENFIDKDGVACTKVAMKIDLARIDHTVGYAKFIKDGKITRIFARYTGINHGDGKAYELGVTGALSNRHQIFKSQAECITAYAAAIKDIKAVGYAQEGDSIELGIVVKKAVAVGGIDLG